jgi:hypothetical protein
MPEQTTNHEKMGNPGLSNKKNDCKQITEQKDAGIENFETYIVGRVQTPSL